MFPSSTSRTFEPIFVFFDDGKAAAAAAEAAGVGAIDFLISVNWRKKSLRFILTFGKKI